MELVATDLMPLAASKLWVLSQPLLWGGVATDLMPLAASKRCDHGGDEPGRSCNRPNAACGIETYVFMDKKNVMNVVATDLMPLAASKQYSLSSIRLLRSGCNRPNAACGIETQWVLSGQSNNIVATDLMPLAASKQL